MGYYKKVIGGIILIIIGIPFIGISIWLYDQASIGLSYCNSFGGIGHLLFEDCDTASIVSSASLVGLLIGGLMFLVGIILLIVGIVKGKKPKVVENNKFIHEEQGINRISKEWKNSKEFHGNQIYCRYCGRTRPLESEYCPRCGKSSISKSEQLIDCNNCHSLISEDSRYCSNCGNDLKEDYYRSPHLTFKTYVSSIHNFKIKYPSHWEIRDESLNPPEILKISTPPDSLAFLMTISLKKPITNEKEETQEYLKFVFKDMIVEPFEIVGQDKKILEAQTYTFKGYNAHKLIAESTDTRIKIFFSILIGAKFTENLTSILDYDKNRIKIFRTISSYAQEHNSIFLSIHDKIIESIEFNENTKQQ